MKNMASHCVLRPTGAASSMNGAPSAQKDASPRPTWQQSAQHQDQCKRVAAHGLNGCPHGFVATRCARRHAGEDEKGKVGRKGAAGSGQNPATRAADHFGWRPQPQGWKNAAGTRARATTVDAGAHQALRPTQMMRNGLKCFDASAKSGEPTRSPTWGDGKNEKNKRRLGRETV